MGRGYFMFGLDNPKTPANVGSALRNARCFGASGVVVRGKRYRRSNTDTQKAYRHLPLIQVEDLHSALPFDCVPVAVDLVPGAQPLQDYVHPERAFYIFGAEDATLGQRVLSWCRDVVYVPTTACMNLAVTTGVIAYDRMVKRGDVFVPRGLETS